MEKVLKLNIVTPYGQVMEDEVDEVISPGTEGEFGVLPGHVPFVTTLNVGTLTYKKDGRIGRVFINSGYAEVDYNRVLILSDSAEKSEDIDLERVEAAKKRAESRLNEVRELKDAGGSIDFVRARAALTRSVIRIKTTENKR